MATTISSTWAQANAKLVEGFEDLCTIAIHSEADGYPFLLVQPLWGIEAMLNKPIRELLGQPIDVVATEIAQAKRRCIERAIASGGIAKESYTYPWQGADWKKQIIATYLPGHNEVLVQTQPYKGEEWHLGFWRNTLTRQ